MRMLNKIKTIYIANSTIFRKFWVNQIAISLLGVMVTWPMIVLSDNMPELHEMPILFAGIFCGGLFCFLIYDLFYQLGAKDFIRISHQKMSPDPYKALKITAVAYLPTLFLMFLSIVFFFLAPSAEVVTSGILNIGIHAMYSGIYFVIPKPFNLIAFQLCASVTFLFAHLGYYLASHDKYLRSFFGITVKINKE